MQAEAIFENIADRILIEVAKAQHSIYVAVAWFTNRQIFNVLVDKANQGCEVRLMYANDDINANSAINFDLLKQTRNAAVFPIGAEGNALMHHKFCVIDNDTVITGSYNWSNKAESNHENITIISGVPQLVTQFLSEFNRIKQFYFPENASQTGILQLNKVIRRLEVIKNLALLEDNQELKRNAEKLSEYGFNPEIKEIINLIDLDDFEGTITSIEAFIANSQRVTVWEDAELASLRLEIRILEFQITAFDNERSSLEKILSEFQHRYHIELGELILEILRLRKIKCKDDQEKYEEANNDEKDYRRYFEGEKDKIIHTLDQNQKGQLKKNFRKATMLCHPDKFSNMPYEVQQQAEKIFKELNAANARNDLGRVNEILKELEDGKLRTINTTDESNANRLRITIAQLKAKLRQLESAILEIKSSDTFKEVYSIMDWDEYFSRMKSDLIDELNTLNQELSIKPDENAN